MSEGDYREMAADVADDIDEDGAPVILERTLSSEYESGSSEVTSVQRKVEGRAVRDEYALRDIDGDSIRFGDCKLLVSTRAADNSAMPEPKTDERMLFDGGWWTVVRCAPIKPATVAVAYQVQVRR